MAGQSGFAAASRHAERKGLRQGDGRGRVVQAAQTGIGAQLRKHPLLVGERQSADGDVATENVDLRFGEDIGMLRNPQPRTRGEVGFGSGCQIVDRAIDEADKDR